MVYIIDHILVNSITCRTERPNSHPRPASALGFPLLHKPSWLLFPGQETSHDGLPLPYTLAWYTQTCISHHIVRIILFSDLSYLWNKCQSCLLLSPLSEDILLIHFWLHDGQGCILLSESQCSVSEHCWMTKVKWVPEYIRWETVTHSCGRVQCL